MYDLIKDTVFGHLVHGVSKGKIFKNVEQRDPTVLEPYQLGKTTTPSSGDATPDSVSINQEKGADHQLVTFVDNDPENPRNWSLAKKCFVTFEICFLTTSVYIGSAIYTPGIPYVMQQFGISQVAAILGLTLFVIGYSLGPMIFSPMSEIPFFGRTNIYIGTLLVFVVLQLGVIYASNIGMLLAFRFLTGFFGSPVLATGGATIADLFTPKKQTYGISVWGIGAVCGPVLGPLVGGYAAYFKGWQWTIWELMWLSGFCLVFLFFLLPETSAANILFRRASRFRKATGNKNLKTEAELEAEGMSAKEGIQMALVRPFTMTFTEPIVFFLNLYIALIYALLYLWFESFPIVFIDIYRFPVQNQGLAFLGIFLGAVLVAGPFFWWYYKYQEPLFNDNGDITPEYRLRPAFVGGFCIPICLFWFGWTSRASVHWIVPIIGSSFFSIGAFLLFMSVLSYLGDAYPKHVASVYASNDLVRSSFGAAFPLFANAMYTKLGVDCASSLLGFLSILFIPIPFVLYKYGEQIRRRSKMARHDI